MVGRRLADSGIGRRNRRRWSGTIADMPGRSLTEHEIATYDVVDSDLARRVTVIRIRFLPGGYAGLTLGRTIFLTDDVSTDGTSTLLAHELVHVQQWADQGLVGFGARYLGQFVRGLAKHRSWNEAYRNIDAERQARREATAWNRRQIRDGITPRD
jgi:hypothetical protein